MLVRGFVAATLAALLLSVAHAQEQRPPAAQTVSSITQYPYLAYLQVGNFSTAEDAEGCTGVLLSAHQVLSGAHCYGQHPEKIDPTEVTVLVGQADRTKVSGGQTRRGKLLSVHPDRSGGLDTVNPYPNIAVLELEQSVELSDRVQPATLLRGVTSEQPASGPGDCEVVGWWFWRRGGGGATVHGRLAASSPAYTLPYRRCRSSYFGVVEHDTQFCVVVPHNQSALGYNGNPVICDGRLIGIRYLRSYLKEDEDRQRLDVAVQLSAFASWLDEATRASAHWVNWSPMARSSSHDTPPSSLLLTMSSLLLAVR